MYEGGIFHDNETAEMVTRKIKKGARGKKSASLCMDKVEPKGKNTVFIDKLRTGQ